MEARRAAVSGEDDADWVIAMEREGWSGRPFARTFDLISQNYGWTDEEILNLTLLRMRQVRDVIWERLAEERRTAKRDRETELRILASYSAQSPQAQKQAQKITLLKRPKEAPVVVSTERAMSLFGTDTTPPEVI